MTTERTTSVSVPSRAGRRRATGWSIVGLVLLGVVALYARTGAVSDRIRNPAVKGTPRPVEPLLGFDNWLTILQVFTVVSLLSLLAWLVWQWRRHPRHPYLLMAIATTALVWQDPIMNWATFAVYDPRVWPYPEAKVFDPQGFYEKNGQQGPYSTGMWSTWMSGQPDGRPQMPPSPVQSCQAANGDSGIHQVTGNSSTP